MAIASIILRSITTTSAILGVGLCLGCTEKCGFIRNPGSSQTNAITKVQARPATWPPPSESITPSKTISPTITPKVETAAAPAASLETGNQNTGLQPVGAQIPPPAPVSESVQPGVVQAQRLETVPAVKKAAPNQLITPAANPDTTNLPLIQATSGSNGGTLVVPPPPPGSPLTSSAPLGIPSAPSGSPNR